MSCAHRKQDEIRAERIRQLVRQPLDWSFITRRANDQQIRALLYRMLSEWCPEAVPEELMQQLQAFFQGNLQRNLALMQECLAMQKLFTEARIEAIPLKGPLQAFRLYGNLALREIADLDFLIHARDLAKAKVLLLSQGFLPRKRLTASEEKNYLKRNKDYDYPFRHRSKDLEAELHWHVLPSHSAFGMESELIWEQATELMIGRQRVPAFPLEVLYLLVTIHNEKHNWRGLKYLMDAACLLEAHRLDWDQVFLQAKRLGREHSILLTAFLCHLLLGAPLDPPIADRIRAEGASLAGLAALAQARLMRSGFRLPAYREWKTYLERQQDFCVKTLAPPLVAGRYFGYVRAIMTPEYIDRVLFPAMPRSLSFLYCITRVLRFLSHHSGIHLPKRRTSRPEPVLSGVTIHADRKPAAIGHQG